MPVYNTFFVTGENRAYRYSTDGVDWSAGGSMSTVFSSTDDIYDSAYSLALDLWVVVGDGGKIGTSPDLTTWTSRTSGVSVRLTCVEWSPALGLFVAGGQSNTLITSPDGVTWTTRTITFGIHTVEAVAWSADLGLFVISGGGGQVEYSSNGTSWTASTDIESTGRTLYTVVWAASLGVFIIAGDREIWTSPDGATWTEQSWTAVGASEVRITGSAAAWSEDLGIWVGGSGTAGADTTSRYDTSTDGTTFTKRNLPSGTSVAQGIAWSPTLGIFVLVTATPFYTSTDGVTFSDIGASAPAIDALSVTWGPGPANRGLVLGSMTLN